MDEDKTRDDKGESKSLNPIPAITAITAMVFIFALAIVEALIPTFKPRDFIYYALTGLGLGSATQVVKDFFKK